MLDQLTATNLNDFIQRYNGTYGWYVDNDKKLFVRIDHVNKHGVKFSDKSGYQYESKLGGGVMFEFLPATRGWYNTPDGGVYFITRVPRKQFQRGISADNHHILELYDKGETLLPVPSYEWQDVIYSIFSQEAEYKPHVATFCEKGGNVALSKQFAINRNAVMFLDKTIGRFITKNKSGTKTIQTFDNYNLKQELGDICRRNEYNFEVC